MYHFSQTVIRLAVPTVCRKPDKTLFKITINPSWTDPGPLDLTSGVLYVAAAVESTQKQGCHSSYLHAGTRAARLIHNPAASTLILPITLNIISTS